MKLSWSGFSWQNPVLARRGIVDSRRLEFKFAHKDYQLLFWSALASLSTREGSIHARREHVYEMNVKLLSPVGAPWEVREGSARE